MSPERLVERAREVGLDRVAVTDHDAIEGALRARELAPDLVIVGQEISCRGRVELIGLFLESGIPSGLPVRDVAARIREQGGVVCAPHPFAYLWETETRSRSALEVADVVEALNARAFWPAWNRRAAAAARSRGLPAVGGSDAHFAPEVGRAYTRMPAFGSAPEFREALDGAEPVLGAATSTAYHVGSVALRALRYATPGRRGSKGPRPWTRAGDEGYPLEAPLRAGEGEGSARSAWRGGPEIG